VTGRAYVLGKEARWQDAVGDGSIIFIADTAQIGTPIVFLTPAEFGALADVPPEIE
jgi:hypothetical protein